MKNRAFINGQDIYIVYGGWVLQGGYDELACFPSLKKLKSNDWAEESGSEVDLSAPVLNTRDIALKMAFHTRDGFYRFATVLEQTVWHDFDFREAGKSIRLRLDSQPEFKITGGLVVCSFKFSDDTPLGGYSYQEPVGGYVDGNKLDGKDLGMYGIRLLQGSMSNVAKLPEVKENLLINEENFAGAIYDGLGGVYYKSRDVKLNGLMRAKSIEEFWHNWNAFLFDLTRPGERSFYYSKTGEDHSCYYKSSRVTEFYPTGKIWFNFSLTLVFTSYQDDILLSSEAGELILSGDGGFYIDLSES